LSIKYQLQIIMSEPKNNRDEELSEEPEFANNGDQRVIQDTEGYRDYIKERRGDALTSDEW